MESDNSLPARFARFIEWLWETDKVGFILSSVFVAITLIEMMNLNWLGAVSVGSITTMFIWSLAKSQEIERLVKLYQMQAKIIKTQEENHALQESIIEDYKQMVDLYKKATGK